MRCYSQLKLYFNYFFSTWYDNEVGIKELLSFAQKNKWNDIAIIRPIAGGFYQFTRDLFIELAPDYDINIVKDINIGNVAVSDFRTHILKIKKEKPDAVFIALNDFTECTFMKQMRELELDIPVLATEGASNFTSLENCADILESLYFSHPKQSESYQDFLIKFKNKFGSEPRSISALTAYDATKIIANILEKTSLKTGSELLNEARNIKNFKGVSLDSISFDEKGFVITPEDAFEIQTVRDGKFVKYEE